MSNTLSAQKFLKSAEADEIRTVLRGMMKSREFNTTSTYSPSSEGPLSFEDKHMLYLSQHTSTNPQHYLSNLRLITRIR